MSRFLDSQSTNSQAVSPQVHGLPSQPFRINALPIDVLYEILQWVEQVSRRDPPRWESIDESILHEEPMVVPIHLSQVCWKWRLVTMTCPSLWSNIDVLFGERDDKKRAEWIIKAVDTCIERSKASPLSIMVSCTRTDITPGAEPNRDAVERILKKLLGQQSRWRKAYFSFDNWEWKRPPKIELVDASILEAFSICWVRAGLPRARQIYIDPSRAPNLKSLHIEGLPHIEIGDGQLSSVTELTYSESFATETGRIPLLEFIQKMPNLESLRIIFFWGKSDRYANLEYPVTTLHRLHTFEVDDSHASAFIISMLILPALTHMICHRRAFACFTAKKLSDIFQRSLPSLERLELIGFFNADDRLAPFFRLLPNLKSLHMVCPSLAPSLFSLLSTNDTTGSHDEPREVSSILCPNIVELCLEEIDICWDNGVVNSFCNMLETRCSALQLVRTTEHRTDDCNAQNSNALENGCNALGQLGATGHYSFDNHDIRCFNVPLVDIDRTKMCKALKSSTNLRVRFMKS